MSAPQKLSPGSAGALGSPKRGRDGVAIPQPSLGVSSLDFPSRFKGGRGFPVGCGKWSGAGGTLRGVLSSKGLGSNCSGPVLRQLPFLADLVPAITQIHYSESMSGQAYPDKLQETAVSITVQSLSDINRLHGTAALGVVASAIVETCGACLREVVGAEAAFNTLTNAAEKAIAPVLAGDNLGKL